jgi:hypothetical protein
MKPQYRQTGISLTGFIVMLLVFVVIAFGTGWVANTYYANRLSLNDGDTADFPSMIKVDAKSNGLTWDGQNLIFSNRVSPWGLVRITPLENGQYRKTTIPVVDDYHQQQVSFQGISWNGTSLIALTSGEWFQSPHKKVFVELNPQTYQLKKIIGAAPEFAHCLAWDGQNYWAGTRFNTPDQLAKAALYKFDQDLKLLESFNGAGKGCQGMTWDGKFLWWGDIFDDSVTLYNIIHSSSSSPEIVHQYQLSIEKHSGIAFDGKDVWFGDYKNQQLKRLQQDLYFEWLGGNFAVRNPAQLQILDKFAMYQTGKTGLDELVDPLLQGKIKNSEIAGYIDTLRSRYSTEEIRHILVTVMEKVADESIRSTLKDELENLIDSGEINYQDNEAIDPNSVKMVYFRASVKNDALIAAWKVQAGDEIYSGLDAPRPQQIPDDYDFYTFLQYTVRVRNTNTGTTGEFDFDFFESEDIREDVVLLENIIPGEYEIDIEMNAQYYTLTTASHYNGNLVIKAQY